ncbi:MAG: hypothetical protein JNL01_11155 [Bdellovibrionales bacterium]|nr:hypothetical protein [Bdellovibrionales bacterium]
MHFYQPLFRTLALSFSLILASCGSNPGASEGPTSAKDAQTQALPDSGILFRFLAATWCPHCASMKKELKASGYLKDGEVAGQYFGTVTIENKSGEKQSVRIQQLEVTGDNSSKVLSKKYTPALVASGLSFYPTLQIYVGDKKVFQGSVGDIPTGFYGFTANGFAYTAQKYADSL